MELKIIRKNIIANEIEDFEFDVEGFEFLVKNFNDFDIYVAFKSTDNTDEMIKIPAQSGQICVRNKKATSGNTTKNIYVYAENSGEVEVQCLKF